MKVLIALAFLALASANPTPLRLPAPAVPEISFGQVIIPTHVLEALKAAGVELGPDVVPVDVATLVQESAAVNDFVEAVRVVDTPVAAPVVAERVLVAPLPAELPAAEFAADAVNVVDAPVADEVAPLAADAEIPADAVTFVDAPLEAAVEEPVVLAEAGEIQVDAVKFVEVAENVVPQADAAEAVRVVDAPTLDQVREMLAPSELESIRIAPEFVQRPAKIYENPMLRSG